MTTINSNSNLLRQSASTPVATTPISTIPVKTGTVTAPPPPAPTITNSNSSTVQVSPAAMSVVRAVVTRATTPITVAQALAATSLSAQTVIKDSAANIQANLGKLAALTGVANIAGITLTDTKAPTITVARSNATGELNSSANNNPLVTLLQKISSSYSLNVTGLNVAEALTLKAPNATTSLSMAIIATPEQIFGNAVALQTLAKAKSIASITLSSPGPDQPKPALELTATQFKASPELLGVVKGDYDLLITQVSAADVLTTAGAADKVLAASGSSSKSSFIAITDTAAKMAASIGLLETAATAGRIDAITISDGKALALTEAQIKASTHVLAADFSPGASLEATAVAAADVLTLQTQVNANTSLTLTKESIVDTAANIQANLNTIEGVFKNQGELSIAGIAVNDKGNISISNTSLQADIDALKTISGAYKLNVTNISINDALSLTPPSKEATLSFSISDTAANISANLDKLQALAKAKSITAISVTDGVSALISISATKLKADADVLPLLTGDFKLGVNGIAIADLSKTLAIKNMYSVSLMDTITNTLKNMKEVQTAVSAAKIQSVVLTDTANPTLSISDAYALMATLPNVTAPPNLKINIKDTASNIIAHARNDIGGIIAKAGTIAVSDSAAPNLTLADAITLKSLTKLDSKTKYNVVDSGTAIAAQANIANETILSGATLVTINKNFTVNEAKAVFGLKTLAKGTLYSITDTAANILAQAGATGDKIITGAGTVTVLDSSANIVANIDRLEALAKTGRLADIKFTDTPSSELALTQTQLVNDAEALGKIISQVALPTFNVTKPTTPTPLGGGSPDTGNAPSPQMTSTIASRTNNTKPVIAGTANAYTTVTLYNNGSATPWATVTTSANGQWSYTPATALTDGDYSITAKAANANGPQSAASPALIFTIDTAPPTAPSLTGPAPLSSNTKPAFSGTAEANSTVKIYNNNGATPIATVTATAEGKWSYTPTTDLAEGSYSYTAKATDVAGNVSPTSTALAFKIDKTPPAAPIATGPTGSTAIAKPVLSGTAEANSTVTLYNNTDTTPMATVTTGANGQWTYTPANDLPEGSYSITAKATDVAGNISVASKAVVFKIDVTPPVAPSVTGPTGTITNNKPALSGVAEANSTVKLYNNGSTTPLATITVGATGQWSYTPTTALTDGAYSIVAKASDAAGNVSTASAALTFTVSTSPSTPTTMSWTAAQATGYEQVSQVALKTVATPSASVSETINLTAGGSYSFGAGYSYSYSTTSPTITMQILDATNTVVASSSTPSQALSFSPTRSGTYTIKLTASNAANDGKITKYSMSAYQMMSKLPTSSGDANVDALLNGLTPYWLHPAGAVAAISTSPTDLIHDGLYSLAGTSSKHQITYSFLTALPADDTEDATGFRVMNQKEQQAVQAVLSYIASVINVTFTLASTPGQGDINFATNNQGGTSAGYANLPNNSGNHPEYLFLANDQASNNDFTIGTYGWSTLVHEVGHTLGLKHPGNYNAGGGGENPPFLPADTDNTRFSIMSYNTPANVTVVSGNYIVPVNPQSFMTYDLEALQYLYGANKSTAANQIINFSGSYVGMQTIWSPNGATINVSTSAKNNLIDLRQGAYSSIGIITPESQTTYDGKNNVGIAYGSLVNGVVGGAGDDIIYANAEGDTIDGGAGANKVFLPGSQSDWTITTVSPGVQQARNNTTNKVTTLKQVQTIAYYDPAQTGLTHA